MARIAAVDIEKRFYDVFASWSHADRESALKVLATVHRHLPARSKAQEKREASGGEQDSVTLSEEAQQKLAIGDKP